jgi:DMSO/TMAO reductase YedYZ heme-binding membrane subunit
MSDQLLWFAARGAGIVSLLFLTGVVYLGILTTLRWQTRAWPRFATTGFHRNLALLSVAFLGIHIATAILDPFTNLGPLAALVPFSSSYRTLWLGLGVIAVDLGAAVLVTSLLRNRLSRATWRAVHWLAYAAWPLALLHGIGTGTDAAAPWMVAIDAVCLAVVGAAVLVRVTTGRTRTATPIMAGMQRSRATASPSALTTAGRATPTAARPVTLAAARPAARPASRPPAGP